MRLERYLGFEIKRDREIYGVERNLARSTAEQRVDLVTACEMIASHYLHLQ